jgi:hypothetical protein
MAKPSDIVSRNKPESLGLLQDPYDFSLVLGGPLYQLLRRAYLCGEALELLGRRILVISLLAWLPLLVLSAWSGKALGGGTTVPFLLDVEVHVRFLVALPLLILGELVIHVRMRPLVQQFLACDLVPERERPRFEAAVVSALRWRNSVVAEVCLIGLVYGVGILIIWRHYVALETTTWYAVPAGEKLQPSLAGWWYGYVSLPIFQFMLLRWYFRLCIWVRFLWQVSRLELSLVPTHPDGAGGLGFLSLNVPAFTPLLLAQGSLYAGMLANRIFFLGAKLPEFITDLALWAAVLLFAVLGPFLVFLPQLWRAKRRGLLEYGVLAQRYVREFDHKWLRGGAATDEPLVGSGDIQSLADLGNSFAVIRTMRLVPFTKETVLQLLVATIAPVLPLTLTMVPLDELLRRLLGVLF